MIKKNVVFLIVVLFMAFTVEAYSVVEISVDNTKLDIIKTASPGISDCDSSTIVYKGLEEGHILVRGYHETPSWADKPFLSWINYHHSGLIVENNPNLGVFTMEAAGYNPYDRSKEIIKMRIEDTDWVKTSYSDYDGSCNKVKHLRILKVTGIDDDKVKSSVQYAIDQDDKKFHLGAYDDKSSKENEEYFYCSKLVWKSYMNGSDVDIDDDGGFYVKPGDLVDDTDTKVVASLDLDE